MFLGIDAATKSGWGVVARGRLVAHGVADGGEREDIHRTLHWLMSNHDIRGVAIESPYMGCNVRTLIQLAYITERWASGCCLYGLEPVLVDAAVWQRALLKGLINERSPREDRKKAAQMYWAAQRKLKEDEADAACIAKWAELQRSHG